jgi:sugar lactone lactonase YvrE
MMKTTRLLALFLTLLSLIAFLPIVDAAFENGIPSTTYTEDYRGRLMPTQDAYLAVDVISQFGEYILDRPTDLFLDADHTLYIADTGNKRVLAVSAETGATRVFQDSAMKRPTGIFVTESNELYVADPEAQTVFVFQADGSLLKRLDKPTGPLYGETTLYRPSKVIVDRRGNVYLVGEGNYNGLIQLNRHGEYIGYFGANSSNATIRQKLIKSLFPEDIVETYFKIVPLTPSNATIDAEGMIYTITRGDAAEPLQKLNIASANQLTDLTTSSSLFLDVAVGPIGSMFVTSDDGLIYEYDRDGNLLFLFGGKDPRSMVKGLFNTISAIAVDDNHVLYVADSAKSEIHIMVPTDFGNLVHEALRLYQDGRYVESKAPWERVLETDYFFDMAHQGIGRALFKEGDMKGALERFSMIGDKAGYSDAFWEVRNQFLIDHLDWMLVTTLILVLAGALLKRLVPHWIEERKRRIREVLKSSRTSKDLSFAFRAIRNPADAMQEIGAGRGIAPSTTMFLFALLFVVKILEIYLTGLLFQTRDLQTISLVRELVSFFGPVALMILANYLVASITDGQGKFGHVVQAFAIAGTPLILFGVFNIALSHVLTLNERFLYTFVEILSYLLCAVLLFSMVKDLHNYSLKETLVNLFLTLFAFLVFLVFLILFNNVLGQLADFLSQILREVFSHA